MAEVRLTPSLPAVVTAGAVSRPAGDAIRAAQRAFFDAALNASDAPAPARAASAVAASTQTTPQPRAELLQRLPDPEAPPTRGLRPGSLLDIRV